ncbi:hypothetical protein PTTG_06991 [Puccinia triticina 1-1 BBBD Race 1]|uniref:Uncharacterized protein n=1 Tax=Puccinia triticina (isolate 1-1 / race 1 (BBBD)) TaxID=630390 RepID=A0A180G8C2_PUCT1|nr:hypothetical protein PTTG_06991 [Puccinia triticina 1-1 BBBD Race 1]
MAAQSSTIPSFQKNGKPHAGVCKLNSLYSTILPKSTSPLCRSIYSLTQTLLELNLKIPSNNWMQTPSQDHLNIADSLLDSILLHPIDPVPPTALTKVSERIPPICRILFLRDLERANFPGWTFAWDRPWESQWNQLLSKFILKHWQNASCAGAFKAFHINPNDSLDEILRIGILHRWFLGCQEGV